MSEINHYVCQRKDLKVVELEVHPNHSYRQYIMVLDDGTIGAGRLPFNAFANDTINLHHCFGIGDRKLFGLILVESRGDHTRTLWFGKDAVPLMNTTDYISIKLRKEHE